MKKHIEKIRSYHPHVRRNIALVASLGITALVAVFWVNSFTKKVTSDAQARAFSEQTKPFALLGKKIGSLMGDMSASVSGIKDIRKNTSFDPTKAKLDEVKELEPGPETYSTEDSY